MLGLQLNHFSKSSPCSISHRTCTWLHCALFCYGYIIRSLWINTLRPRQNGRHFPDDIFNCFFLNENVSILISLKFVSKGQINNVPALVQIVAWQRPGDKPLSEPVIVNLLMHICITQPQWVNVIYPYPSGVLQWHWGKWNCYWTWTKATKSEPYVPSNL